MGTTARPRVMRTEAMGARQRLLPVAVVLAAVLLLWYAGAVGLNAAGADRKSTRLNSSHG